MFVAAHLSVLFSLCTAPERACAYFVNITQDHSLSVGKFLLSPLTKRTESGQYAASLSIRSGRGSGTHDRVFRFLPSFPTSDEAIEYALAQGRSFVRATPNQGNMCPRKI